MCKVVRVIAVLERNCLKPRPNWTYAFLTLATDADKEKMTDITPYFLDNLKMLMEQAKEQKEQEPKSDKTRIWAVIYTDLEKTLAYAQTYLTKE